MAVALPVVVGESDSMADLRAADPCAAHRPPHWCWSGSWIVVIWPWRMPIASCKTLTTGARQLVVQDAAVSNGVPAGRSDGR